MDVSDDNTLVTCFIIERNSAVYGIIIQLECITKYNKLQCVCGVCVGYESTNNYYIDLSTCSELISLQLIMMS